MLQSVRVTAPGKVNLYLAVGRRRPDGYHPLATVFQAVNVYEDVTAERSDDLTLTMSGRGADLPVDESNLAIRAAHALARYAGREPHARLRIHKSVPVAGGMAGGSADAAGTLVALDRLWGLDLPRATLRAIGAELGADVPFCLMGGTAVGTGRGDDLTPLLARGTFSWVIAVQPEGLATPSVFAEFDRRHEAEHQGPTIAPRFLRALVEGDVSYVARNSRNDLAPAALSLHDGARGVVEACSRLALPALVSGSGPTVVICCDDDSQAASLCGHLLDKTPADSCLSARGPVPGARVVAAT